MTDGVDDARRDTIVAIATAQARSAIGIVRLSGSQSKQIAEGICRQSLQTRYAHFTRFFAADDSRIDEGITIYFVSPHSFTGEDIVEFHAHGSVQALTTLQERCLSLGARMAQPGEFTERAFLNGKIDLSQAEAIADIIDAQSEQGLKSANESLQGELKDNIENILELLIELRAYVEGALDFPEEEIDFLKEETVVSKLEHLLLQLQQTLSNSKQSSLLRLGVKAVLTGEPNVGKSTLINRLTGKDVAIVTALPGTTRDRLEQTFFIDGVPITLVDTAGIRETQDIIEEEGVKRATQALAEADLIIRIFDASSSDQGLTQGLEVCTDEHVPVINVVNKMDLLTETPEIREDNTGPIVYLSAATGVGINDLIEEITKQIHSTPFSDNPRIARTRHVDALNRCLEKVQCAKRHLHKSLSAELMAEELLLAQNCLAEITGDYLPDDLLGEIFSRFCLGK